MLGTDVIVAVTAGLRMGPYYSASRWHAEYFEHANTIPAQLITTARIARGQQRASKFQSDWAVAILNDQLH
jgi:hypothetical protein